MSNEITIKIDGIEYKTQEGEYILNAARANEIFIKACSKRYFRSKSFQYPKPCGVATSNP